MYMTNGRLSRRRYLGVCGTAGGLTLGGCLRLSDSSETPPVDSPTSRDTEMTTTSASDTETATSTSNVLYRQGFEQTPIGELPEEWAYHTGREARVVSEIAARGNRSLRLRGEPDGCNESVARRPIPLRDGVRLEFSVKITSSGSVGCHDGRRASVDLRTAATGGVYPGTEVGLVTFTPDGECVAGGRSIGEYTEDEWTDMSVTYRRDSQQVVHEYAIDGTQRATVEREPEPYETDLNTLALESADFTNYWDGIRVTEPS